jgi:hypothetical protein
MNRSTHRCHLIQIWASITQLTFPSYIKIPFTNECTLYWTYKMLNPTIKTSMHSLCELCDIHKHSVIYCRYGLLQMVEQSAIVGQLCDWCGRQKAIGWFCHSRYVTPCRYLSVTRSRQHQDKTDFCKLIVNESRFVNNFVTAVMNIKFLKQHSVLRFPYWPQTYIWKARYVFWTGLNAKTDPLLLKIGSCDHARTLLHTTQGRI